MFQVSHWRVASAAVVFVLAGSSALALAMHDRPDGPPAAYRSWPMPAPAHHDPAVARTAAARATAARTGLQLMSQAAAACRATAFSAIQVARWWGPAGTRVFVSAIWHRPGGQTVAEPVAGAASPSDPAVGNGAGSSEPSVSMIISVLQLSLLQADYVLDFAGHSSAAGRQADLVTVGRPDGRLVARYWIDATTKLPLRRELFDNDSRMLSDITFSAVRFGPGALTGMPSAGTAPDGRPISDSVIAALRAKGWPLPGRLPGGLTLFAATQTPASAGPVIGLSYSDGLSVISLFVQRGVLPPAMKGWQRIAIAGHDAYAVDPDDQTIAWSGSGYVFTVVADAPAGTVAQVIGALPHGGPPGFWARLGRGFRRLVTLANPFR
jgi:sigma-E factor negative regulatory protein RseB